MPSSTVESRRTTARMPRPARRSSSPDESAEPAEGGDQRSLGPALGLVRCAFGERQQPTARGRRGPTRRRRDRAAAGTISSAASGSRMPNGTCTVDTSGTASQSAADADGLGADAERAGPCPRSAGRRARRSTSGWTCGRPVELVEVDVVGTQPAQRALDGGAQVVRGEVLRCVEAAAAGRRDPARRLRSGDGTRRSTAAGEPAGVLLGAACAHGTGSRPWWRSRRRRASVPGPARAPARWLRCRTRQRCRTRRTPRSTASCDEATSARVERPLAGAAEVDATEADHRWRSVGGVRLVRVEFARHRRGSLAHLGRARPGQVRSERGVALVADQRADEPP